MSLPPSQAETAALLRNLSGAAPVETHISAVFVGAETVWKLRKAVRLPFVDFTSLAARRHAAEREFALNAPAAPGLYRDVVPVTRAPDGHLALGGAGEAIDFVVRMARIGDGDFLDQRAARGDLPAELLDQLADTVAAYHAAAPVSDRDQLAGLRAIALGNLDSARAAGLPAAEVAAWGVAELAALDAHASLLAARGRAGFVRRGHGDLHLGNLCLWHGRPTPFDALEFDENLATLDVGYDLAFLLMDLDLRAGRPAANRVLNRYVARNGDVGLVGPLPEFLSMRAMVRAHVEAARGRAGAAAYLRAAHDLLAPKPPVVLAIGGLPGTGKSTLARRLAATLGGCPGALILRSDEIRKRQHGVAPEQHLPESAYSAAASEAVFAALAHDAATAAAAGHAVVADATFMAAAHRQAIAAAAADVPFLGVWLQAPLPVLAARIAARRNDASDADLAVLRRAAAADPGAGDWLAVDATDGDAAAAAIGAALAGLWNAPPRAR